MRELRIKEENKVLRDEVCRQRIALSEYKRTMRDIVERYKNKGVEYCRVIAENAILKNIVMSTPKTKKEYDNVNFEASIEKICSGVPEFNEIAKRA